MPNALKQAWSHKASRLIRSLFTRSESTPHPPLSSQLAMTQLNEDILRYIVSYLSPETLNSANAAHRFFFDAWMKTRYENLTLGKNDKRLLDHLSDPDVAKYVRKVVIRPWFINPPAVTQNIWTNIHEILDPDYIIRETEQRLRGCLRKDIALVASALDAMGNIKEYFIEWNEENDYHPELYKACFTPITQKWMGQLTKLTIKVPPQLLKSLASVRLRNLETLEYHSCTGQMSLRDIDDIHNGFLVFVNNLKDSLEYISFISTHTSLNLDITRIYKSLGLFPKLRSISLSIPFDGAHLSDPLAFVRFLEIHRSTLKDISVLTSRCTVHSSPSDPENINWIQKILYSVEKPFPRLRSLALAIRPLRASLTNVSDFLEMHMSTLDSLILADRAFDYCGFERLIKSTCGPLELEGLRHLRVKLTYLSPKILYYLASKMPGLVSLDIECYSIINCRSDCYANDIDFEPFCSAIIYNKELLVNWKLQRMAIGPQPQDWVRYIEHALVECMPNLRIANSFYTS